MKTLGIDLAARDLKTAACLLDWSRGKATVEVLLDRQSNEELKELAAAATWTGIDVPFGWPLAAIEAISEYTAGGRWTSKADNHALSFRKTDLLVREHTGRWPMSVSSDHLAVTAWRGAQLLTLLAGRSKVDRIGVRGIVEVYPGAALTLWGFGRAGYKSSRRKANREAETEKRRQLVWDIEKRAVAAGWLDKLPKATHDECARSDDLVDALLCALLARAASARLTAWPDSDSFELAKAEGWIHLPLPGSFELLGRRRAFRPPLRKPAELPTWPAEPPGAGG